MIVMRTNPDTRVYDGGKLNYEDKPKVAPAPHMLSALLPLYQLLPLSVAELDYLDF